MLRDTAFVCFRGSDATQGVKADMMSMLPVKRSHQAGRYAHIMIHDGFFGWKIVIFLTGGRTKLIGGCFRSIGAA